MTPIASGPINKLAKSKKFLSPLQATGYSLRIKPFTANQITREHSPTQDIDHTAD